MLLVVDRQPNYFCAMGDKIDELRKFAIKHKDKPCEFDKATNSREQGRIVGYNTRNGLIIVRVHKDFGWRRTNNYYKNLEWCSQSYNVKVGDRSKQLSSKVRIEEYGKVIKICDTINEAAEFLNISRGVITSGFNRNRGKHSSLIHNKYLVYYD